MTTAETKPKQTRRKAKVKPKKITGREFLAWLDGIMEFKGEEWTPSADEWRIILDKIRNVSDLTDPPQQPTTAPQGPLRPQQQIVHHQPQHNPQPRPLERPSGAQTLSSIEIPDSTGNDNFRPPNNPVGLVRREGKVVTPHSDKAGYDSSSFD